MKYVAKITDSPISRYKEHYISIHTDAEETRPLIQPNISSATIFNTYNEAIDLVHRNHFGKSIIDIVGVEEADLFHARLKGS